MQAPLDIQNGFSFYEFDSTVGFWGIPNISREVRYSSASDAVFEVRHNSHGNRDDEPNYAPKKNLTLILGGSNTWGMGVKQEDRYSDLLRSRFGRNVINAGHCSLGLDQVCLHLLMKGEKYKPKTVIVEQHPWAIHRIINNFVSGYLKPVFYIEGEKLKLQKINKLYKYQVFRNGAQAYFKFKKEFREHQAGINLRKVYDHSTDVIFEDPLFLCWKQDYYENMYAVASRLINVMKGECSRLGARLIFLFPPTKPELRSTIHSKLIDYGIPRRRLVTMCEEQNVAYLDFLEPLLDMQNQGHEVIFEDSHLTPLGNLLISETLNETLS